MADVAYGQTDIYNDRNRLLQALGATKPGSAQHTQYAAALDELNRREQRGFQERELGQRQEFAGQQAGESRAIREQREREFERYHREGEQGRQEAAIERRGQDLLHLAENANRIYTDPKQAQQVSADALKQYYALHNITLPEMGTDAGTKAATAFAQSQGHPVVAQPIPATAPSAAPPTREALVSPNLYLGTGVIEGGQAPATNVGQWAATQALGARGGPEAYGFSPPNPNQMIQHGQIYGAPPGRDFNINTGEFVPSSRPGLVSTERGVAPIPFGAWAANRGMLPLESAHELASKIPGTSTPTSQPAPAAAKQPAPGGGFQFGLGSPIGRLSTNLVPPFGPALATGELAGQAIERGAKAVGNLFSGGGAGQLVKGGGPTPEPTPAGSPPTGPFSGSIGQITTPPSPTPAETPPAIPPAALAPVPVAKTQPTPEELLRQVALKQQPTQVPPMQ